MAAQRSPCTSASWLTMNALTTAKVDKVIEHGAKYCRKVQLAAMSALCMCMGCDNVTDDRQTNAVTFA